MSVEETHIPAKSRTARTRAAWAAKRLFAREGIRAALVLLFILNILFFPCIWGNTTLLASAHGQSSVLEDGAWPSSGIRMYHAKTFDDAATSWYFEPSLAFTAFEYRKEAALPLWNPYQAFGAPFAAAMQSQPFYPLTAALSLHLTPFTYTLFLLARLFIAGLCAYFYWRLFVSFLPALAAGIASMLAGYYLLYLTMPHLSVETLLPAALLASEYLLRSRTFTSLVAFSAVLFLVMAGGMPESSALLLCFLYLYIAFRVVSDAQVRSAWVSAAKRVLAASVAGICLSAFLLLPFLEFMRHSFNTHEPSKAALPIPGLLYDPLNPIAFTYFFPLLFGQIWGLRNEVGLVAFFLMLVALLTSFRRDKQVNGALSSLTWFFLAALIVILLKRFGIYPVNNLGKLPIFRYVFFFKYEEFLVSGCTASLCAIGLERLLRGQASVSVQVAALVISFLMAPLAVISGQSLMAREIQAGHMPPQFPEIAVGLAVSALFCVAVSLVLFGRDRFENRSSAIGWLIVLFLTVEMSASYVPLIYYLDNHLPTRSQNPYAGAPYIDFLKSRSGLDRVVGRDSILFPDWASAFQLFDIRDLDAMYYWKYLPFVRNFLGAPHESPLPLENLERRDRFTGIGIPQIHYSFASPIEKRLLQLSSVKYLLGMQPYTDSTFQLLYDREVRIYGYDDVLPRAALFYRAQIEPSDGDVLKKLADPAFDIFQTVLLDATQLKDPQLARIAEVNQGAAKRAEAATITSYRSQKVEINAVLRQSGILVLNDSDYPGWAVEIDGTPARWFTADYLFRGVVVGPGRHVVRFLYRPRTYYEGGAIALAALLGLSIYGLNQIRRTRKPLV